MATEERRQVTPSRCWHLRRGKVAVACATEGVAGGVAELVRTSVHSTSKEESPKCFRKLTCVPTAGACQREHFTDHHRRH